MKNGRVKTGSNLGVYVNTESVYGGFMGVCVARCMPLWGAHLALWLGVPREPPWRFRDLKHDQKVTYRGVLGVEWVKWTCRECLSAKPPSPRHNHTHVSSRTKYGALWVTVGPGILPGTTFPGSCCECVWWEYERVWQRVSYTKCLTTLCLRCACGSYKKAGALKHPLNPHLSTVCSLELPFSHSLPTTFFTQHPIYCLLEKNRKKWRIVPP